MGNTKVLGTKKNTRWLGFGTTLDAPFVLPLVKDLTPIKSVDLSELYKFDGVDDYVDCGNGILSLINGTDNFIAESKATNIIGGETNHSILRLGSGGAGNILIYCKGDSDTSVIFGITTDGTGTFESTYTLPNGLKNTDEHIYKLVLGSGRAQGYVDDIEIFDRAITGVVAIGTSNMYIGIRPGLTHKFIGEIKYVKFTIDNVIISSYDLTSAKLGSEQVLDLSGNGNHGTSIGKGTFTRTTSKTGIDYAGNVVEVGTDVPVFEGARFINDSKGWSDKLPEKAIEFDSNNDEYVDCGDINLALSSVSFFVPYQPKDLTIASPILSKETATGRAFYIIQNGANLNIRFDGLSDDFDLGSGFFTDLSKVFIGVCYDGSFMRIYKNGDLFLEFISAGTINDTADTFQIGSNIRGSSYCKGIIDQPIMWNTGLTGEEVMQQYLYNKKGENYVVAPENVVLHLLLNEESQTQTDISGNGNDGTFYSAGVPATPTLVDGVYDSDTRISNDVLKGISIEGQSTNILNGSNDLSNTTYWSQFNSPTITSIDDAPYKTGYNISNTTANGFCSITSAPQLIPSSNTYTVYAIVRKSTSSRFSLGHRDLDVSTFRALVDFVFVGEVPEVDTITDGVSANVTEIGNGWYLCEVQTTTTVSGNNSRVAYFYPTGYNNAVTGDTDINLLQVEQGSFASSYIPTTTTAVTRTADVSSYDMTDQLEQGQGSLYCEFEGLGESTIAQRLFSLSDGTINNKIDAFINSGDNKLRYQIFDSGIEYVDDRTPSGINFNQKNKFIITYKNNEVKGYLNGTLISTDNSATIPTNLNMINIGSWYSGTNQLNGNEKYFKYNKEVLDEATAKRLTTL